MAPWLAEAAATHAGSVILVGCNDDCHNLDTDSYAALRTHLGVSLPNDGAELSAPGD